MAVLHPAEVAQSVVDGTVAWGLALREDEAKRYEH
jgi:hypothetical protein